MAQPEFLPDGVTPNPAFASLFTGAAGALDPSPALPILAHFPLHDGRDLHTLVRAAFWDAVEDTANRLWRYLFGPRPGSDAPADALASPKALVPWTSGGVAPSEGCRAFLLQGTGTPTAGSLVVTITLPVSVLTLFAEEGVVGLGDRLVLHASVVPPTLMGLPGFTTALALSGSPLATVTVTCTAATSFPAGTYTVNLAGRVKTG